MNNPGSRAGTLLHFRVVAWAMWDCGSTGLNAIVTTFVFSVYLTSAVGQGLPGGTSPASWLGRAGAVAGLTIGVLAPVVGVWVESPHRRRVALSVLTGTAVALTCAMFLIRDDPRYLWAGLVLLAATAASSDLSSVPYNAMLRQLSTPSTAGRISGFGWASGYVGSVALLLVIYLGFMSGSGSQRGLLQLPVANGLNVRMAMLVAAAWLALLGLPLLLVAHRLPDSGAASHLRPACWAATASCGRRSARSGGATATWSTSWWPARYSATGWRPFSPSARYLASTHTGSPRPMS